MEPKSPQDERPASVVDTSAKKTNKLALGAGGLLIAIVAFTLGISIGNGQLHLGNTAATGPAGKLNYSSVDQVYNLLRQEYDGKLDQQTLMSGLKQGLVQATGDPYTQYFTADAYKKFDEQLSGNFSGIGAELGQDADKNLVVIAPISGTPADKAGVKPQDIIAEIDGQTTSGLSVDEAVTKIRGQKGTQVKLTLIRNHSQSIPVTITREDINVPTVTSKTLDGNIGYIHVSTFGDQAGQQTEEAAKKFHDANVKGIVLDLRGDPGGLVTGAVDIASLWLPKGKMIMQEKRGNTVVTTHTASGNDVLAGVPTVVLVDGGSASASEIVAGALLDNKAATLVGEKTYGKGSVQELSQPLPDGGRVKITVARWYRPNGQNIDKKGIEPTKKVTISDSDAAAGTDSQLQAAQDELNK
jgi:carboxyl-terminal processing protease